MKGMKKFTKVTALSLVVFMFVLVLGIQSADATATIFLDDNAGNTVTIVDEGTGDTLAGWGQVGYNGPLGIWTVNVTNGFTYPLLGTQTDAQMHLNSVDVSSSTGGTLDIWFSEINYGPLTLPGVETQASVTTAGTTSFTSYLDNTNTIFGTGNTIGSLGPYSNGSFAGSTTTAITASNPYSLTTYASITHGSGTNITSFDMELNVVPEPISSTLFLVGAGTLGFRRWRKKRAS